MILTPEGSKKLEETIIEELHKKSQSGPKLLDLSLKKGVSSSKETFYRTLRKLLKEEVVTKQGNIYEINRHWLQKLYRFSKKYTENPEEATIDNLLYFKEGDKISYKFKNPNLMGIYWAHTYDMVFEKHDPNIPILVFHPHEWLIHTRTASETFFLDRFTEDKKIAFFTIAGNTKIDKEFKKEWTSEFLQITTDVDYGLKNNEYINVLGDFIFKVTMSKKFGNDIEKFFNKYSTISDENLSELTNICNRNDPSKMVFTRSKTESDKWRAKFKKYFYVPKIKTPQ